jgi:hypothetical protein
MRAFAEAWSEEDLARSVGGLPWVHNITLLAVSDPAARAWYAEAAESRGWTRPVLEH